MSSKETRNKSPGGTGKFTTLNFYVCDLVTRVTTVKGDLSQRSGACVACRPASPKGCHWIDSILLVSVSKTFVDLL